MALAWECKNEFVCVSLTPNAWDWRVNSTHLAYYSIYCFCFVYVPSQYGHLQGILQFMPVIY